MSAGMRGRLAALEGALELWALRDDTVPQPDARRAANTAADAIDSMLRELHRIRGQLASEVRVSDDDAAARADAMLARLRDRLS